MRFAHGDLGVTSLRIPQVARTFGIDKRSFESIERTLRWAKHTASWSHDHPESYRAAQAVAAKTVQFGYIDVPTMMRAAVKGAPIVAVGVALQTSPMSVIGLTEKNIKTPPDIKGRIVAMTPGDSMSQIWPLFLQKTGLKEADFKVVSGDAQTKLNAVINGQADLLLGYVMDQTMRITDATGKPTNAIRFADYGVNLVSSGLIAHRDLLKDKADLVRPRSRLLPLLEAAQARREFRAIVPVSARDGENLDRLMELVLEALPEAQPFYPADMATDRGRDFRIGEILREKLMAGLDREVPYGVAVEVGAVEDGPTLAKVDALIWVAKESQRPIILGRGGTRLKSIGQAARLDIEALLGKKVFLQTHIKVRRNWADDARALRQFGYESES